MRAPHSSRGWSLLADFTAQADHDEIVTEAAAAMVLRNAQRHIPPRGETTPTQLAEAFAGTGRAGDAQRAIMIAPHSTAGWTSFAEAISA